MFFNRKSMFLSSMRPTDRQTSSLREQNPDTTEQLCFYNVDERLTRADRCSTVVMLQKFELVFEHSNVRSFCQPNSNMFPTQLRNIAIQYFIIET